MFGAAGIAGLVFFGKGAFALLDDQPRVVWLSVAIAAGAVFVLVRQLRSRRRDR